MEEPHGITTPSSGDEDNQNEEPAAPSNHHVWHKLVSIWVGALLGLLCRTGAIIVSNLLKTDLSGVVWSNFFASLFMGCISKIFSTLELPKTRSDCLAMTTGFCGTFSSFSSAALELFNVAAGRSSKSYLTEHSTSLQITSQVFNFTGNVFIHIGVPFIGHHLGETSAEILLRSQTPESTRFFSNCNSCFAISSICLIISMTIITLISTYLHSFNYFLYISCALLFALPGASLRYVLSKLNSHQSSKRRFLLGTFVANVSGSLVLAATTLLTLGIAPGKDGRLIDDSTWCCVVSAVGHGFCGALTTMSTFVMELTNMNEKVDVYSYGISSILATVMSFVAIWGSYSWSIGYVSESACFT